jgi:hypothetical protein
VGQLSRPENGPTTGPQDLFFLFEEEPVLNPPDEKFDGLKCHNNHSALHLSGQSGFGSGGRRVHPLLGTNVTDSKHLRVNVTKCAGKTVTRTKRGGGGVRNVKA